MKTYLLRGIPEKLLRNTKVKAAQEGRSIKDVLLNSLETYTADSQDPKNLPTFLRKQEG